MEKIYQLFEDAKEHPKKYLRIQITKSGAYLVRNAGNPIVFRKATIVEIRDNQVVYSYKYDSSTPIQSNLLVVGKQKKGFAYTEFNEDITASGYIHTNHDAEKEGWFCAILESDISTIVVCCCTKKNETLYEEFFTDENQPKVLDCIKLICALCSQPPKEQLVANVSTEKAEETQHG